MKSTTACMYRGNEILGASGDVTKTRNGEWGMGNGE